MKKSIKEWLHYPILLVAIFLASYAFMEFYPPLGNFDWFYMIKFFLVDLAVLIISDKLLHRYFIKEGVR